MSSRGFQTKAKKNTQQQQQSIEIIDNTRSINDTKNKLNILSKRLSYSMSYSIKQNGPKTKTMEGKRDLIN